MQSLLGALWWMAVAASPAIRDLTLGHIDPTLMAAFDIPLFVIASGVAAAGWRPAAWIATLWTLLVTAGLALYATITTEAGWGVLLMAAAAAASVLALCLLTLDRIPTELITSGPFGFRLARASRSTASHVAATFAQIVVMWGLFLGVLPLVIRTLEVRWDLAVALPSVVPVIGVVAFVLASALGIWSGVTMSVRGRGTPLPAATANDLVVAGPYRFVRNPMALAGIAQGLAVGLMMSSWLVVVYALAGSLLWNYAVRPLEEADLEARFGGAFRAYRGAVRCWIPTVPRRPADASL